MRTRVRHWIIVVTVLGACSVSWGQKKASAPDPPDGATNVSMPLFSWTPGSTAVFHNLYLGKTPELTQANLFGSYLLLPMYFHLEGLETGVTYYWRVDEIEKDGITIIKGDVWTFTTLALTAHDPDPADGATVTSLTPVLKWQPGANTLQHRVYFNEDGSVVAQAGKSADRGLLPLATTTLAVGPLEEGKTYCWRVDEILAGGVVQAGPVWSFTVKGQSSEGYVFKGGISVQAGSPIGTDQETLVIFVRASDDSTPNLPSLRSSEQGEFDKVTTFFWESSFDQLSFHYTFAPNAGWYQLSRTYDDYVWTQADIDARPAGSAARQEAIDNQYTLQGDPQGFLTECLQAAQDDGFPVNSVAQVVVVIIGPFFRGWSYLPQNFTLRDDLQVCLPVVVVSTARGWSRTAHEFGHAFCWFSDLYDAAERGVDGWDIMDCTDCGSQTTGWHKDKKAHWFSGTQLKAINLGDTAVSPPDVTVLAPYELEHPLAGSVQSLRLDVGGGVHLYVENRQKQAGQVGSQALPGNGVIITDADGNADHPGASRRPVLLLGGPFTAGDTFTDDSYWDLKIEVTSTGTPQYLQVKTEWGVAPFYDLRIRPWSPPPWESPDIWIDSPVNGWDTYEYSDSTANPEVAGNPIRNGDRPKVGRQNRVYARVFNDGNVAANNVYVKFYVSDPAGIGDTGNWAQIGSSVWVEQIAPGEHAIVKALWTPSASTHTCIIVTIECEGERNADNNEAHENIGDFDTTSTSPWKPVSSEVQVSNPTKIYQNLRLEISRLPAGWTGWVSQRFVPLAPGETKRVQYRIDPGKGGIKGLGSRVDVDIAGWILEGDREVPLGGVTSAVHLVQPSQVTIVDLPKTVSLKGIDSVTVNVVVTPSTGGLPVALDISEAGSSVYGIANGVTDSNGRVSFNMGAVQRNGIITLTPGKTYVFRADLYGSSSIAAGSSPDYTVVVQP